jgi:hypothetical protein
VFLVRIRLLAQERSIFSKWEEMGEEGNSGGVHPSLTSKPSRRGTSKSFIIIKINIDE